MTRAERERLRRGTHPRRSRRGDKRARSADPPARPAQAHTQQKTSKSAPDRGISRLAHVGHGRFLPRLPLLKRPDEGKLIQSVRPCRQKVMCASEFLFLFLVKVANRWIVGRSNDWLPLRGTKMKTHSRTLLFLNTVLYDPLVTGGGMDKQR